MTAPSLLLHCIHMSSMFQAKVEQVCISDLQAPVSTNQNRPRFPTTRHASSSLLNPVDEKLHASMPWKGCMPAKLRAFLRSITTRKKTEVCKYRPQNDI